MVFPPDQRTPAVKSALVQALKNENGCIRQIELKSDEWWTHIYKDHGSAETSLFLVQEVYALKDNATIPILQPWLCCGGRDEMMDFGR